MHLQENTFFDLWVKVTQNIAQYPLHHVTYAPAQFEVDIDVPRPLTNDLWVFLFQTVGAECVK